MAEATAKTPVTMTDGRVVEFSTKQKLDKTSTIEGNSVTTRLDFRNGETRSFSIPPELLTRFAAHGAEQKLGDAIAGEEATEDGVLAVDDLIAQLTAGEWSVRRKAGAFAGTSVLIQALVSVSGKSVEDIRAYLSNKTQEEKLALRRSAKIAPVIAEIEAAKPKKASTVDTDSLLVELGVSATAPASRKPKGE